MLRAPLPEDPDDAAARHSDDAYSSSAGDGPGVVALPRAAATATAAAVAASIPSVAGGDEWDNAEDEEGAAPPSRR